jgi:UPF0755 protein
MNKIFKIATPFIIIITILIIVGWKFLGPAGTSSQTEIFTVPEDRAGFDLIKALKEQGFIKNTGAFQFISNIFAKDKEIKSGGYRLAKNMNAWQVLNKIVSKPELLWVTIPTCQRREQIGEKLTNILGWDKKRLDEWTNYYLNTKPEYFEGVYYPDTYLLPADESGGQIAERFINRFNEKFAPLADKFLEKNIKWTTGLKIASLISREAGGPEDMKLISGVIWNRLDTGMRLQIDATMQYTHGKNPDGSWWGVINISEKLKDSPYNTYLHEGLPPTPICSPGIASIEAALNPEETDCLYYLHDSNKQIHCAKTYKQHLTNIRKYLD